MIRDIVLPQLSMGMSEGTVVEWAVQEGGRVEKDAPLASIETEKVVNDLPSPYRGFVHHCVEAGRAVPVETLIARIAETESEYRQLVSSGTARHEAAPEPAAAPAHPPVTEEVSTPAVTASAAPRRVRASGLARKIAGAHEIDLAAVAGSGPDGRIVRRDVLAALAPSVAASVTREKPQDTGPEMRERARVPLTGMRRTIADRMIRSKTTSAHTYVFFEVDITRLVAARATMLEREKELGGRISMMALYAKALSLACQQVPICNATLSDGEITVWDSVNIGIAVAVPGKTEYESGLIVPVIRDAECKGVRALDREIKDLIERGRSGRLSAAETAHGTVTLSSTAGFMPGQWCVSTPLLNQPQVLNFQPGSPIEKPVVIDGQIAIRTMLPCGLSFDHRAMDGEPVARFNRTISELLAHPELMLLL